MDILISTFNTHIYNGTLNFSSNDGQKNTDFTMTSDYHLHGFREYLLDFFWTLLCIRESLHFSNGFAKLRLEVTILVEILPRLL